MNACSMVNECLRRQQGEQADLGASRGDEDVRSHDYLPTGEMGHPEAYRNLDQETTTWSG